MPRRGRSTRSDSTPRGGRSSHSSHSPHHRPLARVVAFGLGALSVSLGLAFADAPRPATSGGAPAAAAPRPATSTSVRYDPDNITAISQFMETLNKGNDRYLAKDFTGAIDLYKKAIQLNPRHPLGPLLLGEGYLATNNLSEAEAAFASAAELNDPKQPLLRSHALFAVADCFEREKKWEQARAAWQIYAEHAAKLGPEAGAFPQTGAARLKALDDAIKQEQQYVLVRQRIAAEKADAGPASSGDAGKPAAPPKK